MTIIIVGNIALDARIREATGAPLFDAVLNGSAFNGAMAAWLAKAPVAAIMPLGRQDGIHGSLRRDFESKGIAVYAQPDGSPPLSVYATAEAIRAKKPTYQVKDNAKFVLNPNLISGLADLNSSAVVFYGSPTVKWESRNHLIQFAEEFGHLGKWVVLNNNYRDRQQPLEKRVLEDWTEVAQVVTLAKMDIKPLFGANLTFREAADKLLDAGHRSDTGVRLVVVTSDEKGATAFWRSGPVTERLLVRVPKKLDLKDEDGAGDAFAAGIALALKDKKTFEGFSGGEVRRIVMNGHHVAEGLLLARNADQGSRLSSFEPVFSGMPIGAIVNKMGYPAP